jgi:plastocyanin
MKKTIIAIILLISVLLTACTPQSATTTTTQASEQSSPSSQGLAIKHDVKISGFAFSPSQLTIGKGQTVVWTNYDSTAHTISFDSSAVPSSDTINKGETYAYSFTETGTYSYHCSIHPSMKGEIIVE